MAGDKARRLGLFDIRLDMSIGDNQVLETVVVEIGKTAAEGQPRFGRFGNAAFLRRIDEHLAAGVPFVKRYRLVSEIADGDGLRAVRR